MIGRTTRALVLSAAGFATLAGGAPAAAQDADTGARVKKLEAEVRALQRKVFPGDSGKYFEPEITGSSATPSVSPSTPSTTTLTDVLARLDALETQLQRLTAQYEEGANALRLLQDRVGLLEKGAAPATSGETAIVPSGRELPPVSVTPVKSQPSPTAAVTTIATPTKPPATKPAGPNAARLAAVQAILKPQSDDAGEDEYSYGFRLWDAKFFPEAQQQLTLFLDKYPRHARVSYARNLLGRAYLDDGKAKEAAPWFLKNYQADKAGERAGDSLLYLAEAMIALKDTKRACIALAEFSDSYPALAAGRLMSQYEANRAKVKC